MILSCKVFCQILAALNFVRASHSSPETKDRNSLKSRFIGSRALNTTTAETKNKVDSITTSNSSSVSTDSTQYVRLGLSPNPVVQSCINSTDTPTVADCSCSTEQVAAQAINDAITMVQAVQGVWSDEVNLSVLKQFMGGEGSESESCQGEGIAQFVNTMLAYLANISQYRWLPSDDNWISDYSSKTSALYAYCATGVPPSQTAFAAQCLPYYDSFGWVYTPDSEQNSSSFFGFCTELMAAQGLISRASMLESWQRDQGQLSVERLGQNYGRAALNLLVQLAFSNLYHLPAHAMFFDYQYVLSIAQYDGCRPLDGLDQSSLSNAGNWAWWISTLYFNIEGPPIPTPTPTPSSTSSSTPSPTSSYLPITSSDCRGSSYLCEFIQGNSCLMAIDRFDPDTMYTQYASHWFNYDDHEGCTAMFTCGDGYPAGGMSGADIQYYFNQIYNTTVDEPNGCGKCGSVYLSNDCWFTFNACNLISCLTCVGGVCSHP